MKIRRLKHRKPLISIIVFLILAGCYTAFFLCINNYGNTLRLVNFSDGERNGNTWEFNDISIRIEPRAGDNGGWLSDPYEVDGKLVREAGIGTIYEALITNKTANILSDWTLKLVMPERLLINNAWNGTLEFHQFRNNAETVQELSMSNYSSTAIELEYYLESVGPMIWMEKGDWFVYHPNTEFKEMPLSASNLSSEEYTNVLIGFIVYLESKEAGYVADFSTGELSYHLQMNVWNQPAFWILNIIAAAWAVNCIIQYTVYIKVKERSKRDGKIIKQSMLTFINFIEAKDISTKGHSLRAGKYSRIIAREMGLTADECNAIYYTGLLHDCGKVSIPENILTKKGKLTEEEYGIMKQHTVYGYNLLENFSSIDGIAEGALRHHERYDGNGYPDGIAGTDIPLTARIIGEADAFDAMNSVRCYRPNLTREKIMSELTTNRGKQFDPMVLDLLLKLIDEKIIIVNN